ncbi:MAG: helix-turn-helix domain-containing protein [Prochloraceae cyanobacterium]
MDNRPDPITGKSSSSAYRFWKDTQLSRTTAYRLYNDSSYIPTGEVLDKICSTYKIKPGVILDWIPNTPPQEVLKEERTSTDSKTKTKNNLKQKSHNSRHPKTFIAVISTKLKKPTHIKKTKFVDKEIS